MSVVGDGGMKGGYGAQDLHSRGPQKEVGRRFPIGQGDRPTQRVSGTRGQSKVKVRPRAMKPIRPYPEQGEEERDRGESQDGNPASSASPEAPEDPAELRSRRLLLLPKLFKKISNRPVAVFSVHGEVSASNFCHSFFFPRS